MVVNKLFNALIILSVIWGTSFLFIKLLLDQLGPAAVVFGRSLFGILTLIIIAMVRKDKIITNGMPLGILFLVGVINNALPWLFICISETKISSGLASIINATTPLWTLVIGAIFFSTKMKKKQWIGILIGFVGIFILSDIRSSSFTGSIIGIILMMCATACYGMGAQLTRRYLQGLSIMQISLFTLASSTMIGFILTLFTTPSSFQNMFILTNLFSFIGIGMFGSGVAYLLYYFMVKDGSPEFASLVTYLVPVTAIIWGAIVLKETIHFSLLVGLVVILVGVYLTSNRQTHKNKQIAA